MGRKARITLPCGATRRVVDHRQPHIVNGYSPTAADHAAQAARDTVVFVLWDEDSGCTCGQHTAWRGTLYRATDPVFAETVLPTVV